MRLVGAFFIWLVFVLAGVVFMILFVEYLSPEFHIFAGLPPVVFSLFGGTLAAEVYLNKKGER